MIVGLAAFALLIANPAEAGTPLRSLQEDAAQTGERASAAGTERDAAQQAVIERLSDMVQAQTTLRKARTPSGFDDKALNRAMDALARTKAAYDAAIDHERAAVIAGVQADAAARAARQALTDAVTTWSEEGEALEKAATRAGAGEVARTARENTTCVDQDCGPIPPREHTALVLMGAVGPNFDPKDWPDDAAQQMTLLPPSAAVAFRLRTLRQEAADAATHAQETNTAVATERTLVTDALRGWQTALQTLLDAYFRPPAGNNGKAALGADIDALLADSDRTESRVDAYRTAAQAAAAAKTQMPGADAHLATAIMRFGDMGRAVSRAALLAGRGYALQSAAAGLAICRAGQCEPAAGIEAAAFVVIGAAAPGFDKKFTAFLSPAADHRWVFKLP